jgi:hypothetical protein
MQGQKTSTPSWGGVTSRHKQDLVPNKYMSTEEPQEKAQKELGKN